MLALPVSAQNIRNVLESVPEIRANLPALMSSFCIVFRNNSISTRQKFFNNKLVQFMWRKFINDESAFIAHYFKSLTDD